MNLSAGEMTERIRIERNTPSRSPAGAPIAIWSLFAAMWAKPVPQSSREYQRAFQMNPEVRQLWKIRGPLAVDTNMRVMQDERRFDIIGIETNDGRVPAKCMGEIHLLCRTGASPNA